MTKTPGLLGRKKNNFEPTKPYTPNDDSVATNEQKPVNKKKTQGPEKKKFKNQQGSIKISNQSKEELEALMKLTNTKYAYEIIDLLIDHYIEHGLDPAQRRKFKLLTEL